MCISLFPFRITGTPGAEKCQATAEAQANRIHQPIMTGILYKKSNQVRVPNAFNFLGKIRGQLVVELSVLLRNTAGAGVAAVLCTGFLAINHVTLSTKHLMLDVDLVAK